MAIATTMQTEYNKSVEGIEVFLFARREPLLMVTPDSLDKNRRNIGSGSLRAKDRMNKISGVYEIVNTVNGHRYIGSSVDIINRWRVHKSALGLSKHHSPYLQRSWDKYGQDFFEFTVLECCEKEQLIDREQYFIDTLKPTYNISPTAYSCLGVKHSEETKKRISISKSGDNCSDETRIRLSISHKGKTSPRKGCTLSPETRQKISEVQIGHVASEETRAKMRASAPKGENRVNSKLTLDQVNEIRNCYIPIKVSQRKLATEYGVNQQVIWAIVNNKIWRVD